MSGRCVKLHILGLCLKRILSTVENLYQFFTSLRSSITLETNACQKTQHYDRTLVKYRPVSNLSKHYFQNEKNSRRMHCDMHIHNCEGH